MDLATLERRLVFAVLDDEEGPKKYGVWDYAQEMAVKASHFSTKGPREIWEAIHQLKSRGVPVSVQNLCDHLNTLNAQRTDYKEIFPSDFLNQMAGASNGRWLVGEFINGNRDRLAKSLLQTSAQAESLDFQTLQNRLSELFIWGTSEKLALKQMVTIRELLDNEYPEPTGLLAFEDDPPILATHQVLILGGTRGIGKTISCLNIGICLSCASAAFGKWSPFAPVKVLYVHAEAERPYYVQQQVHKLLGDSDRVTKDQIELISDNFKIAVGSDLTDGDVLNIRNSAHVAALVKNAKQFETDLLMLDPLYWISGGVDENKAQDMQAIGQILRHLSNLAECAVLATVHFNKSGRISGSYATEGFASTVIELHGLAAGSEEYDRNDVGMYLTKARNGMPRDGRDAWHIILNPDSLWFDLAPDPPPEIESVREGGARKRGPKPQYKMDAVVEILAAEGDLSFAMLTRRVRQEAECSERTATRMIAEAQRKGLIEKDGKLYTKRTPF